MTPQDIRSACLPREIEKASLCLMDQEIDGTQVNCHVLPAGETVQFSACLLNACKSLWRGNLMHKLSVNIQSWQLAFLLEHDVAVINLLIKCFTHF